MLFTRSAVSVTKLHSSIPVYPSASRSSHGIPWPPRLKRSDPRENGCAVKPNPPASIHARDDLRGRHPLVVDRLGQPEGEVVVAPVGRHLAADQQQHRAVPSLLAVLRCGERVVVGEQQEVEVVGACCRGDLRHRPGAVRIRRVAVDDAGQLVRGGRLGHARSVTGEALGIGPRC